MVLSVGVRVLLVCAAAVLVGLAVVLLLVYLRKRREDDDAVQMHRGALTGAQGEDGIPQSQGDLIDANLYFAQGKFGRFSLAISKPSNPPNRGFLTNLTADFEPVPNSANTPAAEPSLWTTEGDVWLPIFMGDQPSDIQQTMRSMRGWGSFQNSKALQVIRVFGDDYPPRTEPEPSVWSVQNGAIWIRDPVRWPAHARMPNKPGVLTLTKFYLYESPALEQYTVPPPANPNQRTVVLSSAYPTAPTDNDSTAPWAANPNQPFLWAYVFTNTFDTTQEAAVFGPPTAVS